jgi:hypothetical protein
LKGTEAIKIIREMLSDANIPDYEGGEILMTLQQNLSDRLGYQGFKHIGGIQGGEKHNVSIL